MDTAVRGRTAPEPAMASSRWQYLCPSGPRTRHSRRIWKPRICFLFHVKRVIHVATSSPQAGFVALHNRPAFGAACVSEWALCAVQGSLPPSCLSGPQNDGGKRGASEESGGPPHHPGAAQGSCRGCAWVREGRHGDRTPAICSPAAAPLSGINVLNYRKDQIAMQAPIAMQRPPRGLASVRPSEGFWEVDALVEVRVPLCPQYCPLGNELTHRFCRCFRAR